MRVRFLIGVVCLLGALFTGLAVGQKPQKQPDETPKKISGGVLNGKATHLPKPNYPAAAKAVGASGPVSVQVLIDEQGYVATATAVSGHPLLRDAAVEAAHSARFSPTTLNGLPVQVSGIITYNFVTDFSPAGLGYELAMAERTGVFRKYVSPEALAAQLPPHWQSERRILTTLGYEASDGDASKMKPADSGSYSVKGDTDKYYAANKLTQESVSSIRRLQSDIDARLRPEQGRQWAFKVGQGLGRFSAEISDENRMRINTTELEQLVATAPPSAAEADLVRLRAFIEKAKSAGTSPEERKTLVSEAEGLRNLRF